MNSSHLHLRTRRHFFQDCGLGLGKVALASLLAGDLAGKALNKRPFDLPAKAKRVIFLFMAGAPSQLELFDHKPELAESEGKPIPPSVIKGQRYAFIQPDAAVLGPRFKFARHGQSGAELSDRLPHLANVVDDLAFVKSVHTDHFNHAPAQLFVNTGNGVPGRPCMGSWLSYGIGSEANDLPAFVVLKSGGNLSGGASLWGSGFLPSEHQGVPFRGKGDPILHVSNPPGIDQRAQRDSLDLIRNLNKERLGKVGDPEIASRIDAYEMAYRMQTSVPELADVSDEPESTFKLYGEDAKTPGTHAANCLMARRLAERGVRFIQVFHRGWDHHSNVQKHLPGIAKETDQGSAALIADLKQRDMLKDTLVIWGGEFGRTVYAQGNPATFGRDHHPRCFSIWMAGGGVKPGIEYGKTDEFCYNIDENPVHVHDFHATILHCLGIDHERLTYRFQGRDYRLTDVHGNVVHDILT